MMVPAPLQIGGEPSARRPLGFMPRPPRRELAGGIHHVTARGNNGEAIFRDRADRLNFLRLLRATASECRWHCLTYCLMTNHYHLLVLTEEPTLGLGIGRLNGSYAQRFNRRHSRTGPRRRAIAPSWKRF